MPAFWSTSSLVELLRPLVCCEVEVRSEGILVNWTPVAAGESAPEAPHSVVRSGSLNIHQSECVLASTLPRRRQPFPDQQDIDGDSFTGVGVREPPAVCVHEPGAIF